MNNMVFVDINNIKNPESGLTNREENMLKEHNIPLLSLVETSSGLRLYVVDLQRDCDETPLYGLSFDYKWSRDMYGEQYKMMAMAAIDGGYPEESLIVIKRPEEISFDEL